MFMDYQPCHTAILLPVPRLPCYIYKALYMRALGARIIHALQCLCMLWMCETLISLQTRCAKSPLSADGAWGWYSVHAQALLINKFPRSLASQWYLGIILCRLQMKCQAAYFLPDPKVTQVTFCLCNDFPMKMIPGFLIETDSQPLPQPRSKVVHRDVAPLPCTPCH